MTFQLKGKLLRIALDGLQDRIDKICNKIADKKENERLYNKKINKRAYNRLKQNEYNRNYYWKKKMENKI